MAAVQDAAVALLAEHGPRDVTVRQVAERARVNHALIHRHFGTKDGLLRAVVTEESRRIGAEAAALERADAGAMLGLLRAHGAYWRLLARVVLDEPELLAGEQLPAAAAALAVLTGGAEADDATRADAAAAAATALGWLVFGPHLAAVLRVDDRAAVDARIANSVAFGARGGHRTVGTPKAARSRRGGRADPAS